MDKPAEQDRYIGIDVGKDRVEVHIRPDAIAFGCATDAKGLAYLVTRLKPLTPKVIALEATGGYEAIIAATLSNAGLPVAIVNPRQTRQFAGALGRLAKLVPGLDPGLDPGNRHHRRRCDRALRRDGEA